MKIHLKKTNKMHLGLPVYNIVNDKGEKIENAYLVDFSGEKTLYTDPPVDIQYLEIYIHKDSLFYME